MYRKLLKNSILYTLSTIISKAVSFLLLPIFTTYLSKIDYGVLGLITSISAITNIFIGLKPSLFFIVKTPQLEKKTISEYVFNSFILAIYTFLIGMIVLLVIRNLFFTELETYIFILIAFMSLFMVINEIIEVIFQVKKEAIKYSIYQLARVFLSMILALFFIILLKMGWKGKYFADIITFFIFGIFAIFYLYKYKYIKFKIDVNKQRELFNYLFPLTFHVLGLVLMNSIDRIFLANMIGLESVGIYTIAYTIGAILGIIHDALLKVWSPEFYSRIKINDLKIRIKLLKFQYIYIIFSFIIFAIFLLLYPFIFHLMVNAKFESAINIIPIIALGLTFESIRKIFIGYHYNKGKNKRIAFLTLSAGIINAILNYFLIPLYGIEGAAYATLIAYIFVAFITLLDVNKIENIPWNLKG